MRSEAADRLERFARTPRASGSAAGKTPVAGSGKADSMASGSRYSVLGEDSVSEEEEELGSQRRDKRVEEDGGRTHSRRDQVKEPSLADIFAAVKQNSSILSVLTGQVGSLKEDILLLRNDLQKVAERTTVIEGRVSEVEDVLPELRRDVQSQSLAVVALQAKADDLENRLRRNNVRLVGVPEKTEGNNSDELLEKWLLEQFGREELSPLYAVERAHRVPTRPGPPGRPPRPVLVKLLHYKDRDKILRKARERQDISINGAKISFYPDFSADVQKKRLQYWDVKKRLRNLSIPYSMMYPAKLRVVAFGTASFFENPREAARWLDSNEAQLRRLAGEEDA
ncbi:uncharacterized protein LOC142749187 [Rhinoderma darwinii]|uniref:uncharacterized protein LOC142749187 n=1 Tax=Rhinoderma darwinii TaxID=43563 RepID=UPI003F665889